MGVQVPDDLRGSLQDVHWSHGSFGYFPTYSLGSLYAAQLYATATRQNPLISDQLLVGETRELLQWLRNQVHTDGRMYTSREICTKITGEALNVEHLLKYLTDKYRIIYNF
jgi:carboxypeptidase Taq